MVNLGRVVEQRESSLMNSPYHDKLSLRPPAMDFGNATSQMQSVLNKAQTGSSAKMTLELFKTQSHARKKRMS